MERWWYVSEGERKGPVSDDEIERLLIEGRIALTSLVWKTGMTQWQPAGSVLASKFASLPPEIPSEEVPTVTPHWRKHLGSTIALVFGAFALIAGLSSIQRGGTSETALIGFITVLGALAYRSAKKRKLGEARPTTLRKGWEVVLLLTIGVAVLARNNLQSTIVNEPLASVIAPVWALGAYLVLMLTTRKAGLALSSSERPGPSKMEVLAVSCVALFFFFAFGISWYLGSASYALGYAFGSTLIAAIAFAATARSTRNPVWLGVVFAISVSVLLLQNGRKILEMHDARQFQSELSSVAPGVREKVLENSTTQMAAMYRQVKALGAQASSQISAIFAEIDNSALSDALTGDQLSNPASVYQAHRQALKQLELARSAMQRIDAILAEEKKEVKKALSNFSQSTATEGFRGIEDRHSQHRLFYQQKVSLSIEGIQQIGAMLGFVESRVGTYRLESGHLVFQGTTDAETYNGHLAKLEAIAAREEQFQQAAQELQEEQVRKLRELGLQ